MPGSLILARNDSLLLAALCFATGVVVGMALRPTKRRAAAPRRYGGAIRLKPEHYRAYRQLHDNVWPGVLKRMHQSNIRNFTIYYHKETNTMFSHFEWIGHWKSTTARGCRLTKEEEDALFQKDMQAIATDPTTKKWWTVCEPCQQPFSQWDPEEKAPSQGGQGEWWAPLECVNHCGYWAVHYSDQERDPDFETMEGTDED